MHAPHNRVSSATGLKNGLRAVHAWRVSAALTAAALAMACGPIEVPLDPDTQGGQTAPVFDSIEPPAAVEGVQYTLTVHAEDVDGAAVEYALVEGPTGALLGKDGKLTWTPDAAISTPTRDTPVAFKVSASAAGDSVAGEATFEVVVQNNSDNDAQSDAVDTDDDNDGILDTAEKVAGTDPTLADTDGDTVQDGDDNCGTTGNTDQVDTDGDKAGNACDGDDDDDGVLDENDNCALVKNPLTGGTQADKDGDGQGDACDDDADGDQVLDAADNCPGVNNPKVDGKQPDANQDNEGDACDTDDDGDGLADGKDNCSLVPNKDQADQDDDKLGDVCDPDDDNDGEPDATDNCPTVKQTSQKDSDSDGVGDECDVCVNNASNVDSDSDGVCDIEDNCLGVFPADQTDTDLDGQGDVCDEDDDQDDVLDTADNCRLVKNLDQADCDKDGAGDACEVDADGDGVPNDSDNCVCGVNSDQANCDGDSLGDVCDDDIDSDGIANGSDNCPVCAPTLASAQNPEQADLDDDGLGDTCDLDDDGDNVNDSGDNCPLVKNEGQENADADALGDACDPDDDNDSLDDPADNCRTVANHDQINLDGDVFGDACDEDDDNDGMLDGADNCPMAANPIQTDVDTDGVGDVCDSLIPVGPAIAPAHDTWTAAVGRGTFAAAFTGVTPCMSASCLGGSYYAFSEDDSLSSNPTWLSQVSALADPFVADDGAVYFGALDANGVPTLTKVVAGKATPAVGPVSLTSVIPTLRPGPEGGAIVTTTEGSVRKIYHVLASKPAVQLKTATTFGPEIVGPRTATGGRDLYITFQSSGKFGLLVLLDADGTKLEPLAPAVPNLTELNFLFNDLTTKTPWYCSRKAAVDAPELVHVVGGAVTSIPLAGAASCASLTAAQGSDGRIAVGVQLQASGYGVGVVAPGNAFVKLSTRTCAPTPWLFGSQSYFTLDCGLETYEVIDTMGGSEESLWDVSTTNAYGLATAGSPGTGDFVTAWRRNKTGASGIEARLYASGTNATVPVTPVDSTDKPVIQGLWVTDDHVVVAHVLGTFGGLKQTEIFANEINGTARALVTTKGYAEVFHARGITLLAHNGTTGPDGVVTPGLHRLSAGKLTLIAAADVDGLTKRPALIADLGDVVFVAVHNSAPSDFWSVWRIDVLNGTAEPVLNDLVGPPLATYPLTDGSVGFAYEAGSGNGYALISGGLLATLEQFAAELYAERYPGGGAFGYRFRKTGSDAWSVCRLEPSRVCTVMPTSAFLPFTGVDPAGRFSAMWVDSGSSMPTLYRALDLE